MAKLTEFRTFEVRSYTADKENVNLWYNIWDEIFVFSTLPLWFAATKPRKFFIKESDLTDLVWSIPEDRDFKTLNIYFDGYIIVEKSEIVSFEPSLE